MTDQPIAAPSDAPAQAVTTEMAKTGVTTLLAPSTVVIDFYLPRPASAPKHRTLPDRRPDLDKLVLHPRRAHDSPCHTRRCSSR